MLLESVLSGQSGLLFNKLRDEQGLGYTVTAFYRSLPEAGFMAFYIGTTPRNLDVARQGFSAIIKDIKTELLPAGLLAKGLNDSAIHEDVMIGAPDTNVIGTTKNGKEVTIFTSGEWAF